MADAAGGAGGIDKLGTGTLTLNAANTFSGGMQIDGGSVVLGSTNSLQNSTAILNVNNGLNLNSLASVNLGGLSGSGNLALGSTALRVGGNNASTTYSGVMSGAGALTKTGAGTLLLTNVNSFTGATTVNGGTLALSNAYGVLNNTSSLTITSVGTVNLVAPNSLFSAGPSAANVAIVNAGGILTIADGVSSHLLNLTLNGGTLTSGAPDSQYGSWDIDSGGVISATANSTISAQNVHMTAGSSIDVASGVTLTASGTIADASRQHTD